MSLQPDQMLSHYRLVERIGEGGMGVVWRAHDTTLGRDVALKVLPDLFAGDAERLARFDREAKMLASLNHPNIATIHGFHEAGGVRFLAMELASGTSLAKILEAGPLPVSEALGIALQVAEAVEAAHDAGVMHRDLKPGNIQVSEGGKVKVLDFGLAKAFDGAPSSPASTQSPTLTTPATQAGMILGTAAYMSPEQAKGKSVDRRADIWAFGCVLYEMLCGRRAFTGDGVSETLAAVIMAQPDLGKVPPGVPQPIRRLLRRCLEKDPRRRLRDIGEARLAIEETLSGAAPQSEPATSTAPVARRRGSLLAVAAAILIAAAAGAALTRLLSTSQPVQGRIRRFEIASEGPFRSSAVGRLLAISPDGSRVAFVDGGKLLIRRLDDLAVKEVATGADPLVVFWSPDSAWLGYLTAGKLWKAPADGGTSTLVTDQIGTLEGGAGASWGPDGRIALSRGDEALFEISASGGAPRKIMGLEARSGGDVHEPCWLPDGSGIVYIHHPTGGRPDTLRLLSGGKSEDLYRIEGQDIWHPAVARSGQILYHRHPADAGVWALPFSLADHKVKGEPFLVFSGGDVPSVSDDGTLVLARGVASQQSQMVWVDRSGKLVTTIGAPQEYWPFPSLSPDGRSVAVAAGALNEREIWIYDLERGTNTRLTSGAGAPYAAPSWSPAGDRILVDENAGAAWSTHVFATDGRAEGGEIAKGWSSSLSPDGRYLTYAEIDPNGKFTLWYRDLKSGGDPKRIVTAEGHQVWARVSPDSRYVAYVSAEAGEAQIFIRPFPEGERRWQVSVSGGFWPRWSRRGDRLYYVTGETLMEVDVATKPALTLGKPRPLFTRAPLGWTLILGWPPGYDVSEDGQRFLLCRPLEQAKGPAGFILVENWLSEFQRAR